QLGKNYLETRERNAARLKDLADYFLSMAVSRLAGLPDAGVSEAKLYLARVRLSQGRTDDAAALLDGLSQKPEGFQIGISRGDLAFEMGRLREAEAAYRNVIQRFPDKIEGYEQLAMTLALSNQDERAAEVYRSLIAVAPGASIRAYRGLAKASLSEGSWVEA